MDSFSPQHAWRVHKLSLTTWALFALFSMLSAASWFLINFLGDIQESNLRSSAKGHAKIMVSVATDNADFNNLLTAPMAYPGILFHNGACKLAHTSLQPFQYCE
jgi:hypothetical protein